MSGTHRGSCLCAAIRYEVEGDFEHFFLCHCKHCQKDTGSAHAANLFSRQARLRWLAGGDRVVTFRLPSSCHTRSFCPVCGSALPFVQEADGLLVVPAGSLDSEPSIAVNAHLFVASRASWDHELERVPAYRGLPQ